MMKNHLEFLDALSAVGITPSKPLDVVADGKIHRFDVDGRPAGKQHGWYVLHADGPDTWGAFGDWKTGQSESWSLRQPKQLNEAERQALVANMERVRQQVKAEAEVMAAKARAKAVKMWEAGKPVAADHPYIRAKGIRPIGATQLKDMLMVPLYRGGDLVSLQVIRPDGSKTFLSGGRTGGAFTMLGRIETDKPVLICEGWATGCTLCQATGLPVAVAFNAGNLLPVAKALRQQYPDAALIMCADDDWKTEGNPGLTKATEAANTVSGLMVVPVFEGERQPKESDWNDLASAEGLDVVRQQIEGCLSTENRCDTPCFNTNSKNDNDNIINGQAVSGEDSGNFSVVPKNDVTAVTIVTNPVLARLLGHHADGVTNPKNVDSGTDMAEIQQKWYVPHGYRLLKDGVYREFEHKEEIRTELICNPLLVLGLTKGVDGSGHGLLLAAITVSGVRAERTLPATVLHGDPAALAAEFEDIGVAVEPGKAKRLSECLGAMRRLAQHRPFLTAVPRLGWLEGDRLAYQLPECSIGADGHVFQPRQANRTAKSVRERGTLEDWQTRIAIPALKDPLTTVALLAGFAGALIHPARMDTAGLHFYGTTSRGKTTLLQIGASVWGNGEDPNSSSSALCKKWNSTANNLEALAEESTGLILPLDELGSFKGDKGLSRAIYNLCAGQGAGRLNANAERKQQREWQTFILSSGEVSIRESIEKHGESQKGGTAIRVLDIPFPERGLFAAAHDPAVLVDVIKAACAECFGTAGPAFVRFLVERFQTLYSLYTYIGGLQERYTDDLSGGEAPEIRRAAKRLALLRVAGEMAQEAGVMPGNARQVAEACKVMWNMWRGHMPVVDDGQRAIMAIRDYITSNPARFPNVDCHAENLPASGVSGYADGERYLFNDEGFKVAIGDCSKSTAISALRQKNLLFQNNGTRQKSRHTVRALGGRRAEFYAIRSAILEAEDLVFVPEIVTFSPSVTASEKCETNNVTLETRVDTGFVTIVHTVPQKNSTYQNETDTEVC